MFDKYKRVKIVTYIPSYDIEDAPKFTNEAELNLAIEWENMQGNIVVVFDEDGFEIAISKLNGDLIKI